MLTLSHSSLQIVRGFGGAVLFSFPMDPSAMPRFFRERPAPRHTDCPSKGIHRTMKGWLRLQRRLHRSPDRDGTGDLKIRCELTSEMSLARADLEGFMIC
jgi:hypothetical protein